MGARSRFAIDSGRRAADGFMRSLLLLLSVLVLFASQAAADDRLAVTDYKMAGDATRMRVVIAFNQEPELRWLLLRGPHRLVIDLPDTRFALDPKALKPRGLVSGVRYGALGESGARIVLSARGPFAVERVDILPNEEGASGFRLVAELAASSEKEFEAALDLQAQTTASTQSTPKSDRPTPPPGAAKPFTIVIDPGHGGIDGGAEGVSGTSEKAVTLAFAQELRDKLRASGRYDVYLTREADIFLRLDERVMIARQHAADLFISIHADTIRLKGIRGATVYTVSEKASDAEAQALADRENLSDQLAGIVVEEDNHEVADILIDLIRRETHSFSMRFARTLVGELSTSVGLINNPHRSAGFKVLKAPDVPSVLLELGYLSNQKDEEQLLSAEWRAKAADSICGAIDAYVSAHQRAGG